jgi:signal transduction histidine kinase
MRETREIDSYARFVKSTPAAHDRLALLLRAAETVERGLDVEETLQAIADVAREVTGARYAALGVLGPDRRITQFITSGLTASEIERIGRLPTGRGLLGALIVDGGPIRLDEIADDARSVGFPPGHPPMRSFLGVPIRARGEVFGDLYLTEAPDGAFTAEDEYVITLLAVKAGIAIENARLYADARFQATEAQRSADARASVNAIAASILRERDVSKLMGALAQEAAKLLGALLVTVGIPDEVSGTVRFPVAVGAGADQTRGIEAPLDTSIAGTSILAGEAVRVDDAITIAADPIAAATGARSVLAVPMIAGDEAVAVIAAYDTVSGAPFTGEDQELIEGLASLGAVALQTARAFGRERARSEALARLREAEARAEAQRVALRRVVEAQERERRRLAQDLHDRTGGALTALQMTLRHLERERDPAVVVRGLAAASADATAAIEDLRDLIVDLRPRVLDDFGLGPALERLGEALGRNGGLAVDVAADPTVNALPAAVATAAYRVVQESLTNVVRHAQARAAGVSAAVTNGVLVVVVEDDGVGIGPTKLGPASTGGYGLDGMRERASLVDGVLRIERPTSGGTRVTLEVPLR